MAARTRRGRVSQFLAAPDAALITRWRRCRRFEDARYARAPAPCQRAWTTPASTMNWETRPRAAPFLQRRVASFGGAGLQIVVEVVAQAAIAPGQQEVDRADHRDDEHHEQGIQSRLKKARGADSPVGSPQPQRSVRDPCTPRG